MKRKITYIALLAIIFVFTALFLTVCDDPFAKNEGTVIISFGDSGRSASAMPAWPTDDPATIAKLDFKITLTSNGETIIHEADGASEIIRIPAVPVGRWDVEVKAYYEGTLYATGDNTVEIKAHQINPVFILMKRAFEDDIFYTVTFVLDNGEEWEPVSILKGNTLDRPELPVKPGFGFVDWFIDVQAQTPYDFDGPITANLTLYAKWSAVILTVSFESNGAGEVESKSIGLDGRVEKPENPVRTGFVFIGWYIDEDLTDPYDFEAPVTASLTLYAKWETAVFTVFFDANTTDTVGGLDETSKFVEYGTSYGKLPNLTRTGYIFNGWFTQADGGAQVTETTNIDIASDHTLYARWTARPVTITPHANGGSFGVSLQIQNKVYDGQIGDDLPIAADDPGSPVRSGFRFLGWSTESGTNNAVNFNRNTTINADNGVINANTNPSLTLYAVWGAYSDISVSFIRNTTDEVGGLDEPNIIVTFNEPYGTLPLLTRTGYTFNGWFTAVIGGTEVTATTPVTNTANHELFARWTPITYTIVYNGNHADATGTTASSSHTYDVTKTLTANGFVRTGYTFAGWNTVQDGSGIGYADGESVLNLMANNGGIVTLFAQWMVNTFTVTFMVDGFILETKSIAFNGTVTLPTDPAKTGYTFSGWNAQADGNGTAFNASTTVMADITVYAQWTANTYTITYDKNHIDATGATANSSHTYHVSKTLTANGFVRIGYTFTGWNTVQDGSGINYADGESVLNLTANNGGIVTLFAQWTVNTFTVTFNVNGGDTLPAGSETITVNFNAAYGTLPTPTKTGYTFNGWYTAITGGTQIVATTTVTNTSNHTLNAQWTPITYTIVYDSNHADATGATASSSHAYDVTKTLTANGFVRIGYTFAGWNTVQDGSGINYADGASVENLTANNGGIVTLYARWSPITYTITYDKNHANATGTTANSSHTYDESKALTANGFTRTGYTFAGWNTAQNGSGTSYVNNQSVTNLATSNGSNVTLYAQWTPITYTVTYDKNHDDATGATASSSHTYDVERELTENGFTRTNYAFAEWNTHADGTGTGYADNASVINLTAMDGAIVTLYAIWERTHGNAEVTVTLNLDDLGKVFSVDGNRTVSAGGNISFTLYPGSIAGTVEAQWIYFGSFIGSGTAITINANEYGIGKHTLAVIIRINGNVAYSTDVDFTVTP